MSQAVFDELFKNYKALLARVDAHIAGIMETQAPHISCQKGCDDCCRFLNLFPVEAFALSRAFSRLPQDEQALILDRAGKKDQCPLLIDHACMLYPARPVICRTHGFPILVKKDGEVMVDFCPENFKGVTGLPKEAMLDLDQLNTLLTAVNRHFTQQMEGEFPERISISRALTLWEDLTTDEKPQKRDP